MTQQQAILRAEGLVKAYGGTLALRGVDFTVHGGKVNVLIGENGAGKSTLMRLLAGVERPDEGIIRLDGAPVTFLSVRDAARNAIGIVYQELNLCPNLSVSENIFLGRNLLRRGMIDRAAERSSARDLLSRLGSSIDPDTTVGDLRVGQQQLVEIARALAENVRVLIMDEPTSALSECEVETLFGVIGELKRNGVGIVYISHRLEELLRIGDYITVMRDGRVAASAPADEASVPWIIEQMMGATPAPPEHARIALSGDAVLELEDVIVRRPDGSPVVDDVSLTFRAGETVAVYGLMGAGRTELLEYVIGARPGSGAVRLRGEQVEGLSTADRVARRLVLVPEDRQREAIFSNLQVRGNLVLCLLDDLARAGRLAGTAEGRAANGMIRRLGIKTSSASAPINALSGGNQQKVVIGRCLMREPVAILLDDPSRGIDVGARADVFATIRKLADDGLAVVFTTSDLVEALTLADRVVVMAAGRVTSDVATVGADQEMLVRAANQISRPSPFSNGRSAEQEVH